MPSRSGSRPPSMSSWPGQRSTGPWGRSRAGCNRRLTMKKLFVLLSGAAMTVVVTACTKSGQPPVGADRAPVDVRLEAAALGEVARPFETGGVVRARNTATMVSRIVAQVREALFAKDLRPGDFLGTEKDLAERFGVSRIVARDALRTLQALGIAEIKMGKGGGARVARGNPRLFAEVLAVQLDLTGVSAAEIMDAQRAIECLAAEL
ncbi:MAG: FadR family transcriptional regulator, partial [Acidobacteria bacterium]